MEQSLSKESKVVYYNGNAYPYETEKVYRNIWAARTTVIHGGRPFEFEVKGNGESDAIEKLQKSLSA